MDFSSALIAMPNLGAFTISAWVAFKVYTGKSTEHRLAMTICFSFIAINALLLLGEKLVSNIDLMLFLVVLEYLTESIILMTLIAFVMQYVGMEGLVTLRNILIIGSPGFLCVVLDATNPLHHLFYVSLGIAQSDGFHILTVEFGPFFYFWMAYFFSIITITIVLLARGLMDTPPYRRRALWTLMAAMVIIMVTGILIVLDLFTDPLMDVLSIGLTLTVLTIFIGERRAEFVDLEIVRFREAIVGMKDAILILNPSMHTVFANEHAQRILDENAEFLRERAAARGLSVPMGSNKWETVLRFDGVPRHYSISTSDIMRNSKVIGTVLVIHDISDSKLAEENLHRANQGLSTLNQIVRHDIRNDLTALWGYLELLTRTDLDVRQEEYVRKMTERARSVEGHLTFAKDHQAIGSTGFVWHDVQALIEKALSQVDMGNIKVESSIQGVKILADPMLPNVFHCLVDNTVRHGKGATRVAVLAEETDAGLSIIWEDDGPGVPLEHKERIFVRGFGHNTGEGLFLVHEILSMTGVRISEEGEPGKGARFVIRVPLGWYTHVSRTGH